MNSIELKNISKRYAQGGSTIEIIRDASINVACGELVAIVGASGSGKSTLLHIAGLLDRQFDGEVIIGQTSTKSCKDALCEDLRLRELGFIYQYHHLLKDFTARENIAMPRLIAGVDNYKALQEADELLIRLGLRERLNNYPGEMSGGEQQRVAIARSIINKPRVILADEPTGNLDAKASEVVINLFIELAKEYSVAAIIVTHNHDVAKRMDKIYELKHGVLTKL